MKQIEDPEQFIVQWAKAQEDIRAALITSTRAIPNARRDILSDYDVILIVESIQPYVDDRSWINDFGDVLVVYWDPIYPDPIYGINMIANVTQYTSGLKIDFTLQPISLFEKIVAAPALPAELEAGYRVLLDKDGLTRSMLPPTGTGYIPKPPTLAIYQLIINDFFSDAPYVAKCLWRDELMPAKWCLDFDMRYVYLQKFLEWRAEMDHDWSLPVGVNGKGLKKQLPPELWSQVEGIFAGAGIEENWEALMNMIAVFRRVAVEVGEHLGYPYPHEMDQGVTAYVEKIRRMEPPGSAS